MMSSDVPHPHVGARLQNLPSAGELRRSPACSRAIIARSLPVAEGCSACHVRQLTMARTGGGPSNGTNTDSDTEMDEELLKLYQQRPPSLRVNELGVKGERPRVPLRHGENEVPLLYIAQQDN